MTTTALPLRELIHERLLLEGGWMCASEVATIMALPESTVSRTLYRLRAAGLVRSRQVELAYLGATRQPFKLDCRTEWRAL